MLFEDVHWADATSLEVLDLTVERVRALPVLVLITFRPEYEAPWTGLSYVTGIALDHLAPVEVETLAEHVAGLSLPPEVAAQIVAKTDGVPLFVEELTKAVLELGLLVAGSQGWRLDGPLPPFAIPASCGFIGGTSRSAGAGQGRGTDRRRDRPRILLPAVARRRRPRRAGVARRIGAARRGGVAVPLGHAARCALLLERMPDEVTLEEQFFDLLGQCAIGDIEHRCIAEGGRVT